jgi:hypothetical protein
MEGLAWLRAVRRQPGGALAKVVIWSADWDLDIARAARALGAVYVDKCCDIDEIKRLVAPVSGAAAERHRERERRRPPAA